MGASAASGDHTAAPSLSRAARPCPVQDFERLAWRAMPNAFVHTCVRVRDLAASTRFYTALGFEERGRLNFDSAYNVYFGLPGDGDRLELTVNVGRDEPYELGEGYNHFAMSVEDLDGLLARLAALGVEP